MGHVKSRKLGRKAAQRGCSTKFVNIIYINQKGMDKNGDGKLSKKELKDAFHDLGLKFSGWRAGRALRHADANGDGYISDEELNELVKYAKRWGFSLY
ncbi:hypothetical protein ACSBR1_000493 [Camellia fascicularis]